MQTLSQRLSFNELREATSRIDQMVVAQHPQVAARSMQESSEDEAEDLATEKQVGRNQEEGGVARPPKGERW